MIDYKGYVGKVEFDAEAGVLHGEVLGIRDVVTFEGASVDDVEKAFRDSVDDYLAFCAERGEEPDKPCSGKFMLRLSPELHRAVALIAQAHGASVNSWVSDALSERVGREAPGLLEKRQPADERSAKRSRAGGKLRARPSRRTQRRTR